MLSVRYLQRAPLTLKTSTSCKPRGRRCYFTEAAPKQKSAYSYLYSEIFPAMIPVFLLGSAVYLGLQLTQLKLSHEKHMEEAMNRVQVLEAEIDALQLQRASQLEASTPGAISSTAPEDSEKPSHWRWR
ncbi:hypothetical protein BDZ97DRAFT_1911593 [Flammula alnicola]|nr:hypothetical protein BDZ97DRAFT_1911593 [Flammula alnicola]